MIFTGSSPIKVFGPPFPKIIDDKFLCSPQTSYGSQEAAAKLLILELSRKGYFDGISLRLPTVYVRPGKPNRTASGFFQILLESQLTLKRLFYQFITGLILVDLS